MINMGQINFDNNATPGAPLVLKQTPGINAIGTAAAGLLFNVLTVATLPTAATALKGSVVAVSDATTPELGVALTGGGAVFCLALCTGTAWVAV